MVVEEAFIPRERTLDLRWNLRFGVRDSNPQNDAIPLDL